MKKFMMYIGIAFAAMILLTLAVNVNNMGNNDKDAKLGLETIHEYEGDTSTSMLEENVAFFDNNTKILIPQNRVKPSDHINLVDLQTKNVTKLSLNTPEKVIFNRFETFPNFVIATFRGADGNGNYAYRVSETGDFQELKYINGQEKDNDVKTWLQDNKSGLILTKISRLDAVATTDGIGFFNDEFYVACGYKTGYVNTCEEYQDIVPYVNDTISYARLNLQDTLSLNGATITAKRKNPNDPIKADEPYFNWVETVTVEKNGQKKDYTFQGLYAGIVKVNNTIFLVGNNVKVIPTE